MASTANHILYDIKGIASAGPIPSNFRIPDNQILYWIDQTRAKLISQALQKRQDISDVWIQSIPCLDLIEVDKSECCEVTTNCKILRTQVVLPETIETHGSNAIIRVVKPNGTPISELNFVEAKHVSYSKYGNIGAKWYTKNGYIYVIDDPYTEQITIYGIFDRPSELAAFTDCSGSTCYSLDDDYPCSMKMASDIADIVLKTKVYPYLQLPQDTTNDSNNTPNAPVDTKKL